MNNSFVYKIFFFMQSTVDFLWNILYILRKKKEQFVVKANMLAKIYLI
jgi:hypothetical protein